MNRQGSEIRDKGRSARVGPHPRMLYNATIKACRQSFSNRMSKPL